MVKKDEAIAMLVEGLQFEEVVVIPRLQRFLYELRRSDISERVKAEIEMRVIHMISETSEHSKMLTELLRKVAGGSQHEY